MKSLVVVGKVNSSRADGQLAGGVNKVGAVWIIMK